MNIATLRRKAGLTVFSAAYLLNVSPRTLRRWERGKSTPPKLAMTVLDWHSERLLPEDWPNWCGHGIEDPKAWRPVTYQGERGVAAGIVARHTLGADAVAKIWLEAQK